MWIILPVKHPRDAKHRLAPVLSQAQRSRFASLMYNDVLETLAMSSVVEGITVISSDTSIIDLAGQYNAGHILTAADNGYSADAARAIAALPPGAAGKIAVIPADVPQLEETDLIALNEAHDHGITLCPAMVDGGTNGLVFTPPLGIPLLFGPDSLNRYRALAQARNIPVKVCHVPGLSRDMDRPDDLHWLVKQPCGKRAWSWIREINADIPGPARNCLQIDPETD